MLGGDAELFAVVEHGPLHGVVGVCLAAEAHRLAEGFLVAVCRPDALHRHLVHGDGAGFVHTQHRDRPQGLHRGEPAHQRVLFCQPPGAHGKEHGEDHREFLGDHRHGEGNARENALDQAVGEIMVGEVEPGDDAHQDKENPRDNGAGTHQTPRLLLQRSRLLWGLRHVGSDLSVFGGGTDFIH
ncbi:hypothetical protein SDC9_75495 [bioreactor metagenome]|uniref:Uncharacterized protein n=1 Tax=bioreactor metagenome TaxID=1076179 RepID=A0A644YKX1_9ZZZZ